MFRKESPRQLKPLENPKRKGKSGRSKSRSEADTASTKHAGGEKENKDAAKSTTNHTTMDSQGDKEYSLQTIE